MRFALSRLALAAPLTVVVPPPVGPARPVGAPTPPTGTSARPRHPDDPSRQPGSACRRGGNAEVREVSSTRRAPPESQRIAVSLCTDPTGRVYWLPSLV